MHLLNTLQNCTACLKQQESLSQPERNGPAQRLPNVGNRLISHISRHARSRFVRKSLSMPNVQSNQSQHHLPVGQHPLNVSKAPAASHNSAELFDRPTTMRKLLPMYALATDSETKGAPTAMMERSLIAPTWTNVTGTNILAPNISNNSNTINSNSRSSNSNHRLIW
uniref:Uncharacterized protein n=2 Tax=Anopheles atroparvus TaxID=41427 RepID=A0AAG5DS89_ANOAO